MPYEVVPELAAHIERRLEELDMSPGGFEDATGLTGPGLAHLRKGYRKSYQMRTTVPVCRALGWTSDSIKRILAGEPPELLPALPAPGDKTDRLAARVDDVEALIETLTDAITQLTERLDQSGR